MTLAIFFHAAHDGLPLFRPLIAITHRAGKTVEFVNAASSRKSFVPAPAEKAEQGGDQKAHKNLPYISLPLSPSALLRGLPRTWAPPPQRSGASYSKD